MSLSPEIETHRRPSPGDEQKALSLHRLAISRIENGDSRGALRSLRLAAGLAPENATILADLGAVLGRMDRAYEAAEVLRSAARAAPRRADIQANLAVALRKGQRYAEALVAASKACRLDASNPVHFESKAICLGRLGRHVEAARASLSAARLHARRGETTKAARTECNAALKLIREGRFTEGCQRYRKRIELAEHGVPAVQGGREVAPERPIDAGPLVVIAEQGVGDQIMFAGLLPELAKQVGPLSFHCDERLVPTLERSLPDVEFCAVPERGAPIRLEAETPYLYMCDLLPRLRPDYDSYRPFPAYLEADPKRTAELRCRYLGDDDRLLVGIAWRSGNRTSGFHRTLPLSRWSELLTVPGIRFVSLQYGDCEAEVDYARKRFEADIVYDPTLDAITDLDGFAAQVAAMDCVVTIDNTTVHMAGALGRPCLAMLHEPADWRWLTAERPASWYRSVELHRQRRPGDWREVTASVRRELFAMSRAPAPAPVAKATALLLNDTSEWYHWGCTGTSHAIHRVVQALSFDLDIVPIQELAAVWPVPASLAELEVEGLMDRLAAENPRLIARMKAADVVIVNGEGTLHGDREIVRGLLFLCHYAMRRLGLPVQILNHSAYPTGAVELSDPELKRLFQKVYSAADFIAVREPVSRQHLLDLGLSPVLAFDSLPLFIAEHYDLDRVCARDGLVVSGSAVLSAADARQIASFVKMQLDRGLRVRFLHGAASHPAGEDRALAETLGAALGGRLEIVEAKSPTQWLDTIAGARCLVSGRFHYLIAGACLGTPLVPFTSNTEKIQGLLATLGEERVTAVGPQLASKLSEHCAEVLELEPPAPEQREATLQRLSELALANYEGLSRLLPVRTGLA